MRSISKFTVNDRFRQSLYLFNSRQRTKLTVLAGVQVLLGVIDLVAVGILAILGKLAVEGVQSRPSSGRVLTLLEYLQIESLSVQLQGLILGTSALVLLLAKSLISILLIQKSLRAIGAASSTISSNLISRVFNTNRLSKMGMNPSEVLYSVTQGVTLLTIGIIGTFVTIIGDISLIILMFVGIILVEPSVAILSLCVFGLTTIMLSRKLHNRAIQLGAATAQLNVESNRLILETVSLHPDLYVRNRVSVFTKQISKVRNRLMDTNRQLVFLPNVSKYFFETTVLIGAFLLAGFQFMIHDAAQAVAALTIFMASGSRVIPALLRTQQGFMNIRTNLAASEATLQLLESLSETPSLHEEGKFSSEHIGFVPNITIENGNFKFSDSSTFELSDINLSISPGEFVSFVGKSGAGKSTLIDLLVGIKDLDTGTVEISGLTPREAVSKWPGAIAYVPQQVFLIEGTVRENVLLGFDSEEINDAEIYEILDALELSGLTQRGGNLDSRITGLDSGLSGGQIQRLGIARALITNPKMIILDEATSALDAETESIVSKLLRSLHGKVTVVVVAHRLSTVQEADCLYWVENGRIVDSGTFSELRNKNIEFANNADLLGL